MSIINYNMISYEEQAEDKVISGTGEILIDKKENGKERPWNRYKRLSEILFRVFQKAIKIDSTCISHSAYMALEVCSSWLLFRRYIESQVMKLDKANFCRHRLCPVCNWRKSLKLFTQMKQVSEALIQEFPTARYLFLTLTVKNVTGDELSKTINAMNDGFKRLVNKGLTNASAKILKANLLGYAKAMEIKYDSNRLISEQMFRDRKKYYTVRGLKVGDLNPNFNQYHPHFHVLLMVKGDFFKGKNYIKQSEWTSIWRDCMKLDYDPQVDIRAIKPNKKRLIEGSELTVEEANSKAMTSALSETLKYPVKPDSLNLDEFEKMDEEDQSYIVNAVICLSHALKRRRLVTFGGEILKARKKLQLDDIEDGDLIGVDGEPNPESDFELVLFNWMKIGCYVC